MVLSRKALSVSPSSTLAIDSKAKKMKSEGRDIIAFGTGEPDFDTPQHIKEAAVNAINQGFTKYTPAAGIPELRKAICEKLRKENNLEYSPEDIVVSNGAKHALINAFQAICNPGDEVIIPAPYWVSYPEMVRLCDGVPVILDTHEEDNFKLRIQDIEKMITPKTKALILNSPSNPTGMVYDGEELKEIARICIKNNIFIISDEVYERFIYDGSKHVSIASIGEDIKNITITINGLSKTYAMTGWRIGYSACDTKIAKIISNVQSHAASNPNSIAQKAALAAIEGTQEPVHIMVEEFKKRRDYMVDKINSIPGLSCLKPQGAFYVMINISNILGSRINGHMVENSDRFSELLLENAGVAVVPGSGFGADSFVRLSYATSMENIVNGIDRIEKFVTGGWNN